MMNHDIAKKLIDYAHYLDANEGNVYRARAYRRAAETILSLDRPATELVAEKGRDGLEELPGIGSHLSYTINELVCTGEFKTLDAGGGAIQVERLFGSLPGVGPRLARQIHEELGVETLEELEQAAHDGRLSRLPVGPKRLRGIADALAGRLRGQRLPEPNRREPTVADLLAVDRDYRLRAEKGQLPTLTPRRFNPAGDAWLPMLEADRDGWQYRALFSNTALAHRLGQTHDWVVIFFEGGADSGQRTVVTETRGDLRGLRVVRGRERESREYYDSVRAEQPTATAG